MKLISLIWLLLTFIASPIQTLDQGVNENRIFFPILALDKPYYGLAIATPPSEDLDRLNAEWYYVWGPVDPYNRPNFVPMLWGGLPTGKLSKSHSDYILVMNEPNLAHQLNISPKEASLRLAELRRYYPEAKLICCGQSVYATDWMREFVRYEVLPDYWHVHSYIESWITIDVAKRLLLEQHEITGGRYWITEYGVLDGDLNEFKQITEWFISLDWVDRIAPYTNRQDRDAWWAIDDGVEMIGPQDELLPIGLYYRGLPRDQ